MDSKYYKLEIITPFQILYQDDVKHIRIPAEEGYWGILVGHAPSLLRLKVGEVKVETEHETKYYSTSGGIAEIMPHQTTLLVETSEEASQIDVERAIYARDRAQRRLTEKLPTTDRNRAQIALEKANNRLKIAKKIKQL